MPNKLRRIFIVSSIWVLLCSYGPVEILKAQSPKRITFRTDATMVTSDVTVVGEGTSNLAAEDFVIYDNDVAHEVTYFSRNGLPLAIAFLIDSSITVEPYLPMIQVATGAILRKLQPEDLAVLYSFNKNPKRHSKLTYDRVEIARETSKIEFGYSTNIYETITDAAKYLQKNAPNHRRAIIMISDNYHNMNPITPYSLAPTAAVDPEKEDEKTEEARTRALEGAVTVFSIKTPSMAGVDVANSVPRIQRIVRATGGEVLDLGGWQSLQSAMQEALLRLRRQYTLGFNPTDLGEDGSFHKLDVQLADQVRCPDCRILARSGYYAGISSPVPLEDKKKQKKKSKYTAEEADRLIIQQSVATAGVYKYAGYWGRSAEDFAENTHLTNLSDIRLRVQAKKAENDTGKKVLKINLEINTGRIQFQRIQDRYACKLHIGVFYFNEYMNLIGNEIKMLEGDLKETTYKTVMRTGILYPIEIPLKVDKQYVKVVVYDEFSDRAGSTFIQPLP